MALLNYDLIKEIRGVADAYAARERARLASLEAPKPATPPAAGVAPKPASETAHRSEA